MASRAESELSFRKLILRIAKDLNNENCESLPFLHKTKKPTKEKDIPGLPMMEELMSRGVFTQQHPDGLQKVLTDIDRQDLVYMVIEYQEKHPQKEGTKRSFKWSSKTKHSAGPETALSQKPPQGKPPQGKPPQGSNKLPATLMTVLNINSHIHKLVEEAAAEAQLCSKKEIAAIADIKKDFEKLKESIKKGIAVITETHSAESRHDLPTEASNPKSSSRAKKPIPLPKPRRPGLCVSHTQPNLSSLASSESSEISSSSSPSRSEDDTKVKYTGIDELEETEQDTQTGDSGFNDGGTWGQSAMPTSNTTSVSLQSQPHKAPYSDNDDPDYDKPWPTQETEYTELNADTREEPHEYNTPKDCH